MCVGGEVRGRVEGKPEPEAWIQVSLSLSLSLTATPRDRAGPGLEKLETVARASGHGFFGGQGEGGAQWAWT